MVLDDPAKATKAHRSGKEYFVSDEQVKRALEDSIEVPCNTSQIPTNRFGEDAIARFCFGESAEDYGKFLEDAGISQMPLRFNGKDYVIIESVGAGQADVEISCLAYTTIVLNVGVDVRLCMLLSSFQRIL